MTSMQKKKDFKRSQIGSTDSADIILNSNAGTSINKTSFKIDDRGPSSKYNSLQRGAETSSIDMRVVSPNETIQTITERSAAVKGREAGDRRNTANFIPQPLRPPEKPVKLGSQIVGSDFFRDFNLKLGMNGQIQILNSEISSSKLDESLKAGVLEDHLLVPTNRGDSTIETRSSIIEKFIQSSALAAMQKSQRQNQDYLKFQDSKRDSLQKSSVGVPNLDRFTGMLKSRNRIVREHRSLSPPSKATSKRYLQYTSPRYHEVDLGPIAEEMERQKFVNKIKGKKIFEKKAASFQSAREKILTSDFDDEQYMFFYEGTKQERAKFKLSFKDHHESSNQGKKVQALLTELIYTTLVDRMNDEVDPAYVCQNELPKIFRQNQIKFASMMIKSPRMQEFFVNFKSKLEDLMNKELVHNKDLYKMFLLQPRSSLNKNQKQALRKSPETSSKAYSPRESSYQVTGRDPLRPMYPPLQDQKALFRRDKVMREGIEQARFNFRKMQADRKKRQRSLVGMQAFLKKAVDQGKYRTIAEAAKAFNEEKSKSLTQKMELKKKMELQKEKEKQQEVEEKRRQYNPFIKEFQDKVLERTEGLHSIVDKIEDVNLDLKNSVQDCEQELLVLENDIEQKYKNINPGEKIHELLTNWAEEDNVTNAELGHYAVELWLSLEQFEDQLKQEARGFELAYERIKKLNENRILKIKHHCQLQMTAMESAIVETKLNLFQQREQAQMTIADMESQQMNAVVEQHNVDALLAKCNEGLVLRSLQEARHIIRQFMAIVKGKNYDLTSKEKLVNRKQAVIEALEERIQDRDQFIEEERKLRKYYQSMLLKVTRDLKLFENDPEKNTKFMAIHEEEDDLNYQRQIHILLDAMDFEQILCDHVNKYFGHLEGLKRVQDNLNLFGLVGKSTGDEEFDFSVSDDSGGSHYSNNETPRPSTRRTSDLGSAASQQRRRSSIAKREQLDQGIKKQQTLKRGSSRAGINHHHPKKKKKDSHHHETSKSFHDKVTKQVAKKQLYTLLKDALQGNLENAVSTKDTGKCEVDLNEARQTMTEFIREIDPNELENFNFLQARKGIKKRKIPNHRDTDMRKDERNSKMRRRRREGDYESDSLSMSSVGYGSEDSQERMRNGRRKTMYGGSFKPTPMSSRNKSTTRRRKGSGGDAYSSESDEYASNQRTKRSGGTTDRKKGSTAKGGKGAKDSPNKKGKKGAGKGAAGAGAGGKKGKKGAKGDEEAIEDEKNRRKSTFNPYYQELNEQMEGTGLKGIARIHHELTKLHGKKYAKLLQKNQVEWEKVKYEHKMNAVDTTALQEFAQTQLNEKLPYSKFMELFKPNLDDFFESFNETLAEHYEFDEINEYVEAAAPGDEESETEMMSKKQKAKLTKELKRVSLGNMIVPVFAKDGELRGFQLRQEMSTMMYLNNDCNKDCLKKVIQICCYMNRLIRQGDYDSFQLQQVADPSKLKAQGKKQADKVVQVDEEDLKVLQIRTSETFSIADSPRGRVLKMLKDHLIDIQTRMKPKQKNYFNTIWEDMTTDQLMAHSIEGVYIDAEAKEARDELHYEEYLRRLFGFIGNTVHGIGDVEAKESLCVMDTLFSPGGILGGGGGGKRRKATGSQATVRKYNKEAQTPIEFIKFAGDNYLMKKSKNQLILDKAIEDEFYRTVKIFDEFTDYLTQIDFMAHVNHVARLEKSINPSAKKELELFGSPPGMEDKTDEKLLSAAFPTPAMKELIKKSQAKGHKLKVQKAKDHPVAKRLATFHKKLTNAMESMKKSIKLQDQEYFGPLSKAFKLGKKQIVSPVINITLDGIQQADHSHDSLTYRMNRSSRSKGSDDLAEGENPLSQFNDSSSVLPSKYDNIRQENQSADSREPAKQQHITMDTALEWAKQRQAMASKHTVRRGQGLLHTSLNHDKVGLFSQKSPRNRKVDSKNPHFNVTGQHTGNPVSDEGTTSFGFQQHEVRSQDSFRFPSNDRSKQVNPRTTNPKIFSQQGPRPKNSKKPYDLKSGNTTTGTGVSEAEMDKNTLKMRPLSQGTEDPMKPSVTSHVIKLDGTKIKINMPPDTRRPSIQSILQPREISSHEVNSVAESSPHGGDITAKDTIMEKRQSRRQSQLPNTMQPSPRRPLIFKQYVSSFDNTKENNDGQISTANAARVHAMSPKLDKQSQHSNIPSQILSHALKAGKHFKWANKTVENKYSMLTQQNSKRGSKAEALPKARTVIPKKGTKALTDNEIKKLNELRSKLEEKEKKLEASNQLRASSIRNWDTIQPSGSLRHSSMFEQIKVHDQQRGQSILSNPEMQRALDQADIAVNPALHIDFGNQMLREAYMNRSVSINKGGLKAISNPAQIITQRKRKTINAKIEALVSPADSQQPRKTILSPKMDGEVMTEALHGTSQTKSFSHKMQTQTSYLPSPGGALNQNSPSGMSPNTNPFKYEPLRFSVEQERRRTSGRQNFNDFKKMISGLDVSSKILEEPSNQGSLPDQPSLPDDNNSKDMAIRENIQSSAEESQRIIILEGLSKEDIGDYNLQREEANVRKQSIELHAPVSENDKPSSPQSLLNQREISSESSSPLEK